MTNNQARRLCDEKGNERFRYSEKFDGKVGFAGLLPDVEPCNISKDRVLKACRLALKKRK